MRYKFFFIFLSVLILVGCTQSEKITKDEDNLFTYKEVYKTLTDNGLELSKNKELKVKDFKLYYTDPYIYNIENGESFLIYIFNDIDGRKVALEELSIRREKITELFNDDVRSFTTFVAKNALFVMTFSEDNLYEFEFLDEIDTIVFEKLNEGKEYVYYGSGEYWQGELLFKYYDNWGEDISNNFSRFQDGKLQYKGNVDDIFRSPIEFSIERNLGTGKSIDRDYLTNEEGYLEIGVSRDSHEQPSKDTVYFITINWNNKVETIELYANW